MADLHFSLDWMSAGSADPVLRDTSAQLAIYLDQLALTRNEDIWSRTVRDSVLVSAYPLALWFATSWWRLNFEPLPKHGIKPPLDWCLAHELGAANHGFVWPRILFVPDGEAINVWAEPFAQPGQSVSYLSGLSGWHAVSRVSFQGVVAGFVESVLSRLEALGHQQTELSSLWSFVCEDRDDEQSFALRHLEALMGFDPEACPESFLTEALDLQKNTGVGAMSELAPVFGQRDQGQGLGELAWLASAIGIRGCPQVSKADFVGEAGETIPWRQGVDAARQLRLILTNRAEPLSDQKLLDLLGIGSGQWASWGADQKLPVAVAKPSSHGYFDFVPRKRHPLTKRFEIARFLGDLLCESSEPEGWRVTSDLATARQKRQRAFAAEFLCPIDSLVDFLSGDYSEPALEEAGEYFGVSEKTVESLLANNGYLGNSVIDQQVPYRLAV